MLILDHRKKFTKYESKNSHGIEKIFKEVSSQDFYNSLSCDPIRRTQEQNNLIANYLIDKKTLDILKREKTSDINFTQLVFHFAENMKLAVLEKNEILFRLDDIADNFYIIIKGRVAVLKPKKKKYSLTQMGFLNKLRELYKKNEMYLLNYTIKNNYELVTFHSVDHFIKYEKILLKINCAKKLFGYNITRKNKDKLMKDNAMSQNLITGSYKNTEENILSTHTNSNDANINVNSINKNLLKLQQFYKEEILEEDSIEITDVQQSGVTNNLAKEEKIDFNKFKTKNLKSQMKKKNPLIFKNNQELSIGENKQPHQVQSHALYEINKNSANTEQNKLKGIKSMEHPNLSIVYNNGVHYNNNYSFKTKEDLNMRIKNFLVKFNHFYDCEIHVNDILNLSLDKVKEFFFGIDKNPKTIDLDYTYLNFEDKACVFKMLMEKLILSPDEEELYLKYSAIFTETNDNKQFSLFEYEEFINLKTGDFFGDFALDSDKKKRTATIMASDKCYLGFLSNEVYQKYIFQEKNKIRQKDIQLLNSISLFSSIKSYHFEKNYFPDFAPHEFFKSEIISKQGEICHNLLIVKEGQVNLIYHGSVEDIEATMKNLIQKSYSMKFFSAEEANKLSSAYCNGLRPKNKTQEFNKAINKKKDYLLATLGEKQFCLLECILLDMNHLYRVTSNSEKCKLFFLDKEKYDILVNSYKEIKNEYNDLGIKKIKALLKRLYTIKNCYLDMYEDKSETLAKYEKSKGSNADIGNFHQDNHLLTNPEKNTNKFGLLDHNRNLEKLEKSERHYKKINQNIETNITNQSANYHNKLLIDDCSDKNDHYNVDSHNTDNLKKTKNISSGASISTQLIQKPIFNCKYIINFLFKNFKIIDRNNTNLENFIAKGKILDKKNTLNNLNLELYNETEEEDFNQFRKIGHSKIHPSDEKGFKINYQKVNRTNKTFTENQVLNLNTKNYPEANYSFINKIIHSQINVLANPNQIEHIKHRSTFNEVKNENFEINIIKESENKIIEGPILCFSYDDPMTNKNKLLTRESRENQIVFNNKLRSGEKSFTLLNNASVSKADKNDNNLEFNKNSVKEASEIENDFEKNYKNDRQIENYNSSTSSEDQIEIKKNKMHNGVFKISENDIPTSKFKNSNYSKDIATTKSEKENSSNNPRYKEANDVDLKNLREIFTETNLVLITEENRIEKNSNNNNETKNLILPILQGSKPKKLEDKHKHKNFNSVENFPVLELDNNLISEELTKKNAQTSKLLSSNNIDYKIHNIDDNRRSRKYFDNLYAHFTNFSPVFLGNNKKYESLIQNYLNEQHNNLIKGVRHHALHKIDITNFNKVNINFESNNKNAQENSNEKSASDNISLPNYGKFRPYDNKGLIFSMQSSYKKLGMLGQYNKNSHKLKTNFSFVENITNTKISNVTNLNTTNTNFYNSNETTNQPNQDREGSADFAMNTENCKDINNNINSNYIHQINLHVHPKNRNLLADFSLKKKKLSKNNLNDPISILFNRMNKLKKKSVDDSLIENDNVKKKNLNFNGLTINPKLKSPFSKNKNNKEMLNIYNDINYNYISKLKM